MKLNNTLRQAIASAICDAIPRIDYDEQLQKLVQDYFVRVAPPAVRDMYNNPQLRKYLLTHMVRLAGAGHSYFSFYCVDPDRETYHYAIPDTEVQAQVEALGDKNDEQANEIDQTSAKVKAAVASFNTTQALLKAYPEWEKYIPKESTTTANLPAHANLISDLVKLGWPEEETK